MTPGYIPQADGKPPCPLTLAEAVAVTANFGFRSSGKSVPMINGENSTDSGPMLYLRNRWLEPRGIMRGLRNTGTSVASWC